MTFGLEFHRWHGFHIEGDLFWKYLVLGFLTIGVCKGSLSDKLRNITKKLEILEPKIRSIDPDQMGEVVNIPHGGIVL